MPSVLAGCQLVAMQKHPSAEFASPIHSLQLIRLLVKRPGQACVRATQMHRPLLATGDCCCCDTSSPLSFCSIECHQLRVPCNSMLHSLAHHIAKLCILGSLAHTCSTLPAARRPSGRSAIQRRAAAANFAVAAAVAAEAADAIPMSRDHSSRAPSKSQHNHRRMGSLGPSKTGLDHVRSGHIIKTVSGGSSGGGSSGGLMRFSSLMDALGDMEARQGGFQLQQQPQQLRPTRTLSLGEPNSVPSSQTGASQRPALFDRGFVSRWHEPVGPVSPSILTLNSDLFQLGPSPFVPEGWNAPSFCHSSQHAGHGIQPQYPLFKSRECAG